MRIRVLPVRGVPASAAPGATSKAIHGVPRVLQRGVRLDESVPGSGLGLAIVRDLVDLYGGDLHLQTQGQGRGLLVTLILPATG